MSTLSDRIKLAMDEKQCKAADVARAAGVKEASVSDWVNNVTKSLKAEPAIKAAQYLGVSPFWLVLGKGPKNPSDVDRHISELAVQQNIQPYRNDKVNQLPLEQLSTDERVIVSAFRRADNQTKAFLLDSAAALLNRLDGFESGIETRPSPIAEKSG